MSKFINKWTGLAIGGVLALGAPLGWLFITMYINTSYDTASIYAEIRNNQLLYSYLLLATETVFLNLGYMLGALFDRLNQEALADPLTNMPNRRLFEPALKTILSKGPTAVLMVDLDNFKSVNDQLGHQAGDAVLVTVSNTIQKNIRYGDICARFGGDEFVIILPNAELDAAYTVSQRLLTELNNAVREVHPNCGASIGIGAVTASDDPAHIIKLADSALYQAKQSGGKTIRHLLDHH